jgi:archaeosine synthase
VVMASAASLVGRPPWFIDAVMRARERAGPGRLLYLPGVATPRNLALLSYLGVDVVDDIQCHLEAARGRRIRPELGHVHRPEAGTEGDLVTRNLSTMRAELTLVREVVEHSALRELVEVRVRSEPWQVAALRRVDRHHRNRLLPYCPVHREAPLLALSRESLERIEVTSWVESLMERYEPPANVRVLVLLPCSARKPYGDSRTHRRIAEVLANVPNRATVHEVILTSPLGAVPRELERMYPAAHYDIPVSGDWFPDEVERMRSLVEHIRTVGTYDAVISHLGPGLPFLEEDGSVSRSRTEGEGALDNDALRQLAALVTQSTSEALRTSKWERRLEDLASLARFQFGKEVARALLEDGQVAGRPPGLKLKGPDGDQRAMVVPARGRLSLTLSGAMLVAAAGHHRVWMDDFDLRGDLFAVGVIDADPGIRPGDEAVVVKGDLVVGVGVARMGTPEMLAAKRGTAVAMRHHQGGGGSA